MRAIRRILICEIMTKGFPQKEGNEISPEAAAKVAVRRASDSAAYQGLDAYGAGGKMQVIIASSIQPRPDEKIYASEKPPDTLPASAFPPCRIVFPAFLPFTH